MQASTVAFAPARALTSHARRAYQQNYAGHFHFSKLVFAFDAFLLGCAVVLIGINLFLFFGAPSTTRGIALSMFAPPIRASQLIPIEARVTATDGQAHDDVVLAWHLPTSVEVVSSQPPLLKDGSVSLGTINALQDRRSRLLIRVRAPIGTDIPFGFDLRQGASFLNVAQSGHETRRVESGALQANTALPATAVVSGASLPLRISNEGNSTVKNITLRLLAHDGATNARLGSGEAFFITEIAAHTTKFAFIDLGMLNTTSVNLTWQIEDGARVVDRRSTQLSVVTTDMSAAKLQTLMDSQSENTFQVLENETGIILGARTANVKNTKLDFNAAARYYTDRGDQVGVGPIPPHVGEQTTAWIVWSIGATENDLSNIIMQATLPTGVTATGKSASAAGGIFASDKNQVRWELPRLLGGTQQVANFSFEISVTPTKTDLGKILPLIGASQLTAQDEKTKTNFSATTPGDDSRFAFDTKAKSDGMVR